MRNQCKLHESLMYNAEKTNDFIISWICCLLSLWINEADSKCQQ